MSGIEQPTDGDFTLNIQPEPEIETREKNEKLEKFFLEANVLLGGGDDGIELDLSDMDYRVAFNRSLDEFRGLSTRSIFMSYGFLQLSPNVQTYRLHRAIDNVVAVHRKRALFDSNNTAFDYFSQIAAGMIYPGSQPGGYLGVATYDFALQYEETLNRVFARDMRFVYKSETNTIYFLQVPRDHEMVVIECAVLKTINELLSDHWAKLWLQKYTIALCKTILGNKWGKFPAGLPGAQGGVQINWQKLAQEGTQEMKELRDQIFRFEDGSVPAWPMQF